MYEIGRICVKIAGRDAGLKCVVVDVFDDCFVLIDGQTRRRKCNVRHLEPLKEVIKIKKNASHTEVVSEFKKFKIDINAETKPKKVTPRPVRQKKVKDKPKKESLEQKAIVKVDKKEPEAVVKVEDKTASKKADKPKSEKSIKPEVSKSAKK